MLSANEQLHEIHGCQFIHAPPEGCFLARAGDGTRKSVSRSALPHVRVRVERVVI